MATVLMPSRGEIWLINFDPSVGAEVQKLRPAVVVSIDGETVSLSYARAGCIWGP